MLLQKNFLAVLHKVNYELHSKINMFYLFPFHKNMHANRPINFYEYMQREICLYLLSMLYQQPIPTRPSSSSFIYFESQNNEKKKMQITP